MTDTMEPYLRMVKQGQERLIQSLEELRDMSTEVSFLEQSPIFSMKLQRETLINTK